MIIVTSNEIPGFRIHGTYGEVFGLTVRSRNIGSNIGAGFKAMAGGELKGITTLLTECRQEALNRLATEAQQRGANAVVAFRFETTEYGGTGIEVCAYGTAVYAEQLAEQPQAQQGPGAHQGQPVGAPGQGAGPAGPGHAQPLPGQH